MKQRLAVCHQCRLKHLAAEGSDEAIEFFDRHRGHVLGMEEADSGLLALQKVTKADLFRMRRKRRIMPRIIWPWQRLDNDYVVEFEKLGSANYGGNANVKQAFGGETAFDLTSLNSLASSNTAGWQSQYVDNTGNLYLDALVYGKFVTGGTAGASKLILFFLYGSTNNTDFPNTGAVSSGTTGASNSAGGALTFLDVTSNQCPLPLVWSQPVLSNSIAYVTPAFSLVATLNSALMPFWGVALANISGWTFAASGNAVKYTPVYYTVI